MLFSAKISDKNCLRLGVLALMLAGCQPTTQPSADDQAQAAQTSLMARHDTLMQRTFGLYKLRQQLAAPALKANPRTPAAVRGLLAADGAMSDWMQQYHAPDSTAPAAQRLAYFEAQNQQLAAVEKQMLGTIDSATVLLQTTKR